jgi:putative tryptophan/tyrosine transport system substrate-binding protein
MRKKLIAAFVVIALAILAPTHPAGAQQAGNMPRIGFLASDSAQTDAAFVHAFSEGLREHGWVEGQNIAIEYRWALGTLDRLPQLTAELVHLQVAVIFATNTPVVVAVKQTGTTIPVVFAAVSEPIEIGAVASLARPGGNYTGLTTSGRELMPKRLELLKEAMPQLTRVGYLANPTYAVHQPQLQEMQAAARSLGMELHPFEVRDGAELERAFAGMAAAHVGAFIVQQDPLFISHRRKIVDLAAQSRLPGMYIASFYTDDGGLISYGAHREDLYRRAATYVDKILKGAKPADLPIERPIKFELVINLKTAKALGLTIPPTLFFQADKVIQ